MEAQTMKAQTMKAQGIKTQGNMTSGVKKEFRKFSIYLSAVFFLSVLSAVYVIQMTGVLGNSMEPELLDGQKVLVNKMAYSFHKPERFDVVVFRYLYKDRQYYIKRIIGLPGETVQIVDGSVLIDGERLDDPYASEPISDPGRAGRPIALGEDEYFLLGDNRSRSSDSRLADVGNVRKVQFLGKAVAKLWPFRPILKAAAQDKAAAGIKK